MWLLIGEGGGGREGGDTSSNESVNNLVPGLTFQIKIKAY